MLTTWILNGHNNLLSIVVYERAEEHGRIDILARARLSRRQATAIANQEMRAITSLLATDADPPLPKTCYDDLAPVLARRLSELKKEHPKQPWKWIMNKILASNHRNFRAVLFDHLAVYVAYNLGTFSVSSLLACAIPLANSFQ